MKVDKKLAKSFFQENVDDYRKEFYESGYRTFMSVRLERFVEEIESLNLEAKTLSLDAGCGPGYLTYALNRCGYKVTALDASPEMLRLTKQLLDNTEKGAKSVALREGDIEELPFEDNYFGLVASAGVLEYLPTDSKVLLEFNRVLQPGGYLVLSSTNKLSPVGYFELAIEAIKRNNTTRNICNWFLSKLGGTPVRARKFSVRKHTQRQLTKSLRSSGFDILKVGYFYALPFPHPLDRMFPVISSKLGGKLENLNNTFIKHLFEGIYVVAKKSKTSGEI